MFIFEIHIDATNIFSFAELMLHKLYSHSLLPEYTFCFRTNQIALAIKHTKKKHKNKINTFQFNKTQQQCFEQMAQKIGIYDLWFSSGCQKIKRLSSVIRWALTISRIKWSRSNIFVVVHWIFDFRNYNLPTIYLQYFRQHFSLGI